MPTVDLESARSNLPPHVFIGKATIDGELAPPGTIVAAFVGGNEAGKGLVLDNGQFTILIPFPNQIVSFSVGGFDTGQTAPTEVGGADVIDLSTSSQ